MLHKKSKNIITLDDKGYWDQEFSDKSSSQIKKNISFDEFYQWIRKHIFNDLGIKNDQ